VEALRAMVFLSRLSQAAEKIGLGREMGRAFDKRF
jgi:hypothetical protein